MKRLLVLLVAVLALVGSACGSDSEGAADTADPSPSSTTTKVSTTTDAPDASEPDQTDGSTPDGADACVPYLATLELHANLADIATGSYESQVQADTEWAKDLDALRKAMPDDPKVAAAVETLGQVSFQVSAEEPGGEADASPTEKEIAGAFDALDAAFGADCAATTGECPAPETLEAEGYTCDENGNLTPVDETPKDGVLGPVEECPAPETLEAEGYTCDDEGYLTPVG